MMKRRDFGRNVFGAAVAACAAGSAGRLVSAQGTRVVKKNTLMHVGGDYHSVAGGDITSKQNLEFNLRYGVKHLTVAMKPGSQDGDWNADELKMMKENCDKYGVTLEAIRMDSGYIKLKKGPARDRKLDSIIGNIQKAAHAGVKLITYHW